MRFGPRKYDLVLYLEVGPEIFPYLTPYLERSLLGISFSLVNREPRGSESQLHGQEVQFLVLAAQATDHRIDHRNLEVWQWLPARAYVGSGL